MPAGWWRVGFSKPDNLGLQPDDIEFGVSRAVAWDCPIDLSREDVRAAWSSVKLTDE